MTDPLSFEACPKQTRNKRHGHGIGGVGCGGSNIGVFAKRQEYHTVPSLVSLRTHTSQTRPRVEDKYTSKEDGCCISLHTQGGST